MEFMKVSSDGWNFEEEGTGKRMVPFGANFFFPYSKDGKNKKSLMIMTSPEWDCEEIRKAFHVAAECRMNIMKVFFPLPALLPDPQPGPGAVLNPDLVPSYPERLAFLFQVARETGVYISLSLAEWGMGGAKWFHDGGEFFGNPEGDGVDSFAILRDFWRQTAEMLKDEPALFSYNLAVEPKFPPKII
ncbi:MAG TPA: hypothetical protein DD727_04735, partial [Clostridiales bacterium]|nr:hypothetical protein [Clostridiales bacterium]